MPTDIKLKNSVTATNAPTSLQQGEVAINITDKKVWVGNAATTPVLLLGSGADGTFTNLTVSGVATFGAGTVSLPSITTTGDTNTGIFFPAADTIAFTEGGVESMRITSAGLVGIGCTPVANLQIGASSDVGIAMSNSSSVTSGSRGSISMYNSDTSTVGYIRFGAVTDNVGTDIQFATRPASGSLAERVRIDSVGRLLIGTTSTQFSSSERFEVTGGLSYFNTPNGDTTIVISNNATGNQTLTRFYVGNGATEVGKITTDGTNITLDKVRGITFPATQSASSDANTLDDYEEGTFTPTFTSGLTSVVYATQTGKYTKIGNLVHFQLILGLTSANRDANIVTIAGLPFTASNSPNTNGGAYFVYADGNVINSTSANLPLLYIATNATTVQYYNTAGGSFVGNDLNSSNPSMYLCGSYLV
jgi:hypothetical protein